MKTTTTKLIIFVMEIASAGLIIFCFSVSFVAANARPEWPVLVQALPALGGLAVVPFMIYGAVWAGRH